MGILFAEFQNARDDIPDAVINGHQAFGMKLPDGYMQSPRRYPVHCRQPPRYSQGGDSGGDG